MIKWLLMLTQNKLTTLLYEILFVFSRKQRCYISIHCVLPLPPNSPSAASRHKVCPHIPQNRLKTARWPDILFLSILLGGGQVGDRGFELFPCRAVDLQKVFGQLAGEDQGGEGSVAALLQVALAHAAELAQGTGRRGLQGEGRR